MDVSKLIERLTQNAGWRDERQQCVTSPTLLTEAASALTAERERADKAEEAARTLGDLYNIQTQNLRAADRKLAEAVEVVRAFDRLMDFAEVWQPCGCFDEPDALQDVMRSARAFIQKQEAAHD